MTGHTKEPWEFQEGFANAYALSDGTSGLSIHIAKFNDAQVDGGCAEADANGRRAVDCVNALAGMNPAALGALIEAAEEVERRCADFERINLGGKTPDAKALGTIKNCREIIATALANFRGGAQ